MAFKREAMQMIWSREAANEWRQLPAALRIDVSNASEWIFRRLLETANPRDLIGQSCYGGALYELPDFFAPPYYCGFLWRNSQCGFFCLVRVTSGKFSVKEVYAGSLPPANNPVRYGQIR